MIVDDSIVVIKDKYYSGEPVKDPKDNFLSQGHLMILEGHLHLGWNIFCTSSCRKK